MAAQLVLDLPLAENWDEADFVVTAGNERALSLVRTWPAWNSPVAILFGPPQSGKTYLARLWQRRSRAEILDTAMLLDHGWKAPYEPIILEDLDRTSFSEKALFHHLNLAREHGSFILMTARTAPGQWRIELPDLRSRIRACPAVAIEPPDDEHFAAFLLKHFADRQIEVTPDIVTFLVTRIERSISAAQQVIAFIDRLSLAQHRKVTRAFVAKAFKELDAGRDSDDICEAAECLSLPFDREA